MELMKLTTKGGATMMTVIDAVEEAIINGDIDDAKIVREMAMFKKIEERMAEFKEKTRSTFLAAYENVYGEKATDTDFGSFKISTTPARWDYSESDDWEALKRDEKMIAEDRKALEKKMQIAGLAKKVGGGERYVAITLKKQ